VVAHATELALAAARAVRHQAGGTERRPMTAAPNLREAGELLCVLAVSMSHAVTGKNPHHRVVQRGTPRARVLFPLPVPPRRC
jgi:hypothetical protein